MGPLGLNTPLQNWILVFLTNRPQYVQRGNNRSDTITLNTGSPQGCVLSPLLYTLMTHDCCAKYNTNHIIKYVDNTTVVGLIQDGEEKHYRQEVKLFDWWSSKVEKTKELGPHVQRVRTHKRVVYALFHVNDQTYQERNDSGNVRCLTPTSGLSYALFYSY